MQNGGPNILGLASSTPDEEARWAGAKAPGQAHTGKSTRRQALDIAPHFKDFNDLSESISCMLLDGRQTDGRTVGRKKMVDRDGTIRREGGGYRRPGAREERQGEGEGTIKTFPS